jgi:hypothetical protein
METPNLNNALEEIGEDIVTRLKREASVEGFKATGELDKSFGYKRLVNELNIYANEYAKALNSGASRAKSSRNSFGKIKRIREWAEAKGIRPLVKNSYGNSTFAKYKGKGKTTEYDRMVFRIAKSISQKGLLKKYNYKGSGFMDRIAKEQRPLIKDKLTRAFEKDLLNSLKNTK